MAVTAEMAGGGPWRRPGPHVARPRDRADYVGSRMRLFWIALGRMMLTILTAGVGRFWMITRLRRFYWSSVVIDGAPLEYTGRPLEKLLGFCVAVVILAVYLLVVNVGLAFVGLAFFQGEPAALQLPLLAIFPLFFWARYRARRYILARTRWRGIRFGLAPGAWGYMWRATGLWALTILTLGLLYPLTQWTLARYTTERSYYGDLRFEQRGGWGALLKSWLWVWLPAALFLAGTIAVGAAIGLTVADAGGSEAGAGAGEAVGEMTGAVFAFAGVGLFFAAIMGPFMLIFAFIRHQVFAFRYLTSAKTLGGRTTFTATLGVWPVIGIYAVGYLVVAVGVAVIGALCASVGLGAMTAAGASPTLLEDLAQGDFTNLAGLAGFAVFVVSYLPAIAVYVALGHAFVSHPLLKEIAATTTIHDAAAATRARQRVHDEQAEAGGFADALGADVGGAF